MTDRVGLIPCPECGALWPDVDGPTHAYVGGSPGCWRAFGELGAQELALGIAGPDRLSVHVYMVQHPGMEGRRQAQSVDVHLMVLGAVLARGHSTAEAVAAMPSWLRTPTPWPWLVPPASSTALTLASVPSPPDPAAADAALHEAAVRRWAESVWSAWSAHHDTIRGWLDANGVFPRGTERAVHRR